MKRSKRLETPVPCDCPSATHEHGTDLMYLTHRCGCPPCKEAHRAMRAKARAKSYQDGHLIDAEPTAQHIRDLMTTHGYRLGTIADLSGVSRTTLGMLRNDRQKRISTHTREAILGVRPRTAPDGRRDATGTRRRLQSLTTLGWSMRVVGDRCGVDPTILHKIRRGHQRNVFSCTYEAVKGAYDDLSMSLPATDTREQRTSVTQSRMRAEANGWLPPLAWDDDRLDDPDYHPNVTPLKQNRDQWIATRFEELRHLVNGGIPPEQAALRAGYPNLKAAIGAVRYQGMDILALQLEGAA